LFDERLMGKKFYTLKMDNRGNQTISAEDKII
jgi:hypothetical protein